MRIGPRVYVEVRDAVACGSSGRRWRSRKDYISIGIGFEEADDESSGGRNQETARDGWGGRELRALYLLSVVGRQFCTCVLLYLHCRGGGELSEEEERDGWSRGHQGAYRAMHSSDTVEPTVT